MFSLLPPSFCLSEVKFPLLFSLFSPEKIGAKTTASAPAASNPAQKQGSRYIHRCKHGCQCVFLTGRMGSSCCDPLEVLLFILVELPSFPSLLYHLLKIFIFLLPRMKEGKCCSAMQPVWTRGISSATRVKILIKTAGKKNSGAEKLTDYH